MSGRLFGRDVRASCKYCEHILQSFEERSLLCAKRGIVPLGGKCRHFLYDPLKRVPKPPKPLERLAAEEFAIV